MKKRRSFFEKLTGVVQVDDHDEDFDDELRMFGHDHEDDEEEEENDLLPDEDGQLSVDVVNTPDEILIKTMVAGVKPQDLDIQISRDMITIRGERSEDSEITEEDYYHRELYWGSFSRNIILPEEVDVEQSEAKEKHGLLIIRLPKLDKDRKTKLSVRSN